MAYSIRRESHHSLPFPSPSRPTLVGIAAVALTKLADALTTYVGIQAGFAEANPVPAAIMHSIGTIPGIALVSWVSVVLTVAVIESGVLVCERVDATQRFVPWARVCWYTLAVSFHVIVAGYNAALIGGWI